MESQDVCQVGGDKRGKRQKSKVVLFVGMVGSHFLKWKDQEATELGRKSRLGLGHLKMGLSWELDK